MAAWDSDPAPGRSRRTGPGRVCVGECIRGEPLFIKWLTCGGLQSIQGLIQGDMWCQDHRLRYDVNYSRSFFILPTDPV